MWFTVVLKNYRVNVYIWWDVNNSAKSPVEAAKEIANELDVELCMVFASYMNSSSDFEMFGVQPGQIFYDAAA